MKIVVDTNVLISGVFFGGFPRQVLSSIVEKRISAFATTEIVNEYEDVVHEMISRKQGHLNLEILSPLVGALEIIESVSNIQASRDPDDDKFINCAKDAHALYIVSGDKDLLVLQQYDNIQIITAKEFCERYLTNNK
jgi:putative PIN family toxin of toxin-antitoxin system